MRITGLDEVQRNLEKWQLEVLERARRVMEEITIHLAEYAKSNHPWEGETGGTEASVRGFVEEAGPGVITAVVTAGAGYNAFLELARSGKWAWLWPAVEANEDYIKAKLTEIFK